MARPDPHSFTQDTQPVTRHVEWEARVDFSTRRLDSATTLHFQNASPSATSIDLDTRGLAIASVSDPVTAVAFAWSLAPPDPILGAKLTVQLPPGALAVRIRSTTSPEASALQWLEPAQTLGGQKPYLFSQCQAIHARSLVPCQDTPARRVTVGATLRVPSNLVAVMAAAPRGHVTHDDGTTTFRFEMPQPIPPYLFAFAVGDLASKDLSPRARVWAEPGMLEAAAWEFAQVERHLDAAEALFGPYDWERFDLLVMPPSFPYGGMENPRLTFLTPTLLAGDRSLVNVLAHELAHSWTGNLVTNVNAEHFWLNEGFTVFAERRILEVLEGPEMAQLHAALGRTSLDAAVAHFEKAGTPELSRLRVKLEGVDPDEAFSPVPYEKGYLLLRAIEDTIGRPAFATFLKSWLASHRFGSASTDDFIAHLERAHPGVLARVNGPAWFDAPGVPDGAPKIASKRLDAVRALVGSVPETDQVKHWSTAEWQLFLEGSPRPFAAAQLAELDARFALSTAKNAELHVGWLLLALGSGSTSVRPQVEALVERVGRMKYLKPIFTALLARADTKAFARTLFTRVQSKWHPIAQQVIAGLLVGAGQ